MKKLGVLVVIGLMSVTASAVDWVIVSQDEAADLLIDRDSISQKDRYSTANLDIHFKEYIYTYDTPHNQMETLTIFECDTPFRYRDLSITVKLDGKVIDSYNVTDFPYVKKKWSYPKPGTNADLYSKLVCTY